MFFSAIFIIIGGVVIIYISTLKLPDFKLFDERKIASSTKIYDRTGEHLLYDVHQDIKRTVIADEEMGTNIKNAVVAIEDSEFYTHKGVRIKSTLRALFANLTGKKVAGGGSTITQQLIKNTLLTQEKTLTRKIKEWILAIKLEKVASKQEILALYLNEAPYGGTVYGIKEASRMFFGKNPVDLTIAESAYMAAIPNLPTYYSPYGKNKDKLDDRKNLVLRRMQILKFITDEEYEQAKNEEVLFLPQQPGNISAPHFVFFVKEILEQKYGANTLESGGLKVTTTLDYDVQMEAEKVALERAKENEKNFNGKNTAVVAIDPHTGDILAMVGSRNYFDKEIDGNFNVTTALRQPGSAFKPFVYATAFNKGFTSEAVMFDVFTEFNASCDSSGKPIKGSASCYHPQNYDDAFRGPMTLKNALAQSINIIAVKTLYIVGIKDAIKTAQDLGITSLNDPSRYGLSLVIGGGETKLLEMVSAYGAFATEGIRHPYRSILKIEDNEGNILEENKVDEGYRVLPENTTKIISDILSDNVARTPTFGVNSQLVTPGINTAVKTGTTNDNKDAWTIGYTTNVVVGAWAGNNDNIPMKKGGAALAGPVWNKVITFANKKYPSTEFNSPDPIDNSTPPALRGYWQGGETFVIDSVSGKLATEYTPIENRKETSITNVHNILYWIDRDDILKRISGNTSSPLFRNWEIPVQNWWVQNSHKYKVVGQSSKPTEYDNIHTEENKPQIKNIGLQDMAYKKESALNLKISTESKFAIKKIDIFLNNTYLTSLQNGLTTYSFTPSNIEDIASRNTLTIIAHDTYNNSGQESFNLDLE